MIKATDVKELRDLTNVGMMECKKALLEADGNRDEAIKILKKKGLAIATKRLSKETNEGMIFIEQQENKVWMVSVCCETDFVAKNENYASFVKMVGEQFVTHGESIFQSDDFKNKVSETIAQTGEKIDIAQSFFIESNGLIKTYLHGNKKVGVVVILESAQPEILKTEKAKQLAKDLCLQITAMDPIATSMDDVSEEVKNEQKEIFLKQMENDPKPDDIKEKILTGKINKYFSEKCLLEMEYVKESGSVKDYLNKVGKEIGGELTIKIFKRNQIGN